MLQDGERRLVTFRVIDAVMRHPNADALDLVQIGGWQCVTKLNEFKVGDSCIYIEVDSMLPDGNPAWQFLVDKMSRMTPDGKRARLKTIRLRGEYSQGLALPLSAFAGQGLVLGGEQSLDEQLNVIKYDPVVSGGPGAKLNGNARGTYPSWLPKTDLERIENCFNEMQRLGEDVVWVVEEKLEGSSCTVYSDNGELGITSRNIDFKLDDDTMQGNAFIDTVREQGLDKIVEIATDRKVAIRGELCGPGIQGNIYNLDKLRVFVFDVYDGDAGRYLTFDERQHFLRLLVAAGADVDVTPIICERTLPTTVQETVRLADGDSVLRPGQLREGLSWKTQSPVGTGSFKPRMYSFKSVSRDYLSREK